MIPAAVEALIDRFEARRPEYMSPNYMEARVRIDFLNPMFSALGWDLTNAQGLSERAREVVTEGRLRTSGGGLKFPDYVFQLAGRPLFPVEAKKPSVNLRDDPAPALQLRRYAWNSAKMGIGILTDFQEFSVYDCRIAPAGTDKANKARVAYYTVDEYHAKWDEISSRFSKEAVLDGALSEYTDQLSGYRGRTRVDKIFLNTLEGWRTSLAINIARNNKLSTEQINTAVQLIIDRIVFLRVAEDRDLERYGELRDAVELRGRERPPLYPNLIQMFAKADLKYNSGLFRMSPEKGKSGHDSLTQHLTISNTVLKPFIDSLYWPAGPYDFSLFPPDVLGQVYEQFLGKVIHLSGPRTAIVEEKPEVRKSKGVFYTPSHIVRDIVQRTLTPLLLEETPRTLERTGLRVCDPSCGSGSFLIEVYQFLLDWHLHNYIAHNSNRPARGASERVVKNEQGVWCLTTSERKRILLQHVFGVDIDPQAVEVTKLALLMKVLEGASGDSVYEQGALFEERVLPDLDQNIKCGNSLVGNSIHFSAQTTLDKDFERRVNAFDWDVEFPIVSDGRGFDALVGNPPWLMAGYYVADSADYLRDHFSTATGKFDLYYLFLEQALRLLAPGGYFGVIVPNKMFHTKAAKAVRSLLSNKSRLLLIQDFGVAKVFEGATNYSCILHGQKGTPNQSVAFESATETLEVLNSYPVSVALLQVDNWTFQDAEGEALFSRLANKFRPFEDFVDRFGTGVQTGSDRILSLTAQECLDLKIEPKAVRPILRGRDVRAFRLTDDAKRLIFPYRSTKSGFELMTIRELQRYPKALAHLEENREALAKRIWFDKNAAELSGAWYGLMYLEQEKYLNRTHLLTPALSKDTNFALGTGDLFATGTAGVTSMVLKDGVAPAEFYLAVLNSTVVRAWIHAHSPIWQGGYRKFSAPYLRQIPIPTVDTSKAPGKAIIRALVQSAHLLTELEIRVHGATTDDDLERGSRLLSAAKVQNDRLVMDLYELSQSERSFLSGRMASAT